MESFEDKSKHVDRNILTVDQIDVDWLILKFIGSRLKKNRSLIEVLQYFFEILME